MSFILQIVAGQSGEGILFARQHAERSSASPRLWCRVAAGRARDQLRLQLRISIREARGVLVAALQSERAEETRD